MLFANFSFAEVANSLVANVSAQCNLYAMPGNQKKHGSQLLQLKLYTVGNWGNRLLFESHPQLSQAANKQSSAGAEYRVPFSFMRAK